MRLTDILIPLTMENKENTPNPSAFARSANYVPDSLAMTSDYDNTAEKGMSLRDYFAAKALSAIVASNIQTKAAEIVASHKNIDVQEAMVMMSYDLAQLMLKERMKYED